MLRKILKLRRDGERKREEQVEIKPVFLVDLMAFKNLFSIIFALLFLIPATFVPVSSGEGFKRG